MTSTPPTVPVAQQERPVSGGAWAREIADLYNGIAHNAVDNQAAAANAAEASKYYEIAARMDRALPARDEEGGDPRGRAGSPG